MTNATEILEFWFRDALASGNQELAVHMRRWFEPDARLDRQIAERFGRAIEQASQGQFASWKATARGRLALIILLDQFPRNAFRGMAKAYACDSQAVEICLEGLSHSDCLLSPIERVFYYLPLLHSESVSHQKQSVACFRQLAKAAGSLSEAMRKWLRVARTQRRIIAIFGRFPHRNIILQRRSTVGERLFLVLVHCAGAIRGNISRGIRR